MEPETFCVPGKKTNQMVMSRRRYGGLLYKDLIVNPPKKKK